MAAISVSIPPFIVALLKENSNIIADAQLGFGGQIKITATGIYGVEVNKPVFLQRFSDQFNTALRTQREICSNLSKLVRFGAQEGTSILDYYMAEENFASGTVGVLLPLSVP